MDYTDGFRGVVAARSLVGLVVGGGHRDSLRGGLADALPHPRGSGGAGAHRRRAGCVAAPARPDQSASGMVDLGRLRSADPAVLRPARVMELPMAGRARHRAAGIDRRGGVDPAAAGRGQGVAGVGTAFPRGHAGACGRRLGLRRHRHRVRRDAGAVVGALETSGRPTRGGGRTGAGQAHGAAGAHQDRAGPARRRRSPHVDGGGVGTDRALPPRRRAAQSASGVRHDRRLRAPGAQRDSRTALSAAQRLRTGRTRARADDRRPPGAVHRDAAGGRAADVADRRVGRVGRGSGRNGGVSHRGRVLGQRRASRTGVGGERRGEHHRRRCGRRDPQRHDPRVVGATGPRSGHRGHARAGRGGRRHGRHSRHRGRVRRLVLSAVRPG